MGILSTNTHLIGVQGGNTSGAVRYDIEQALTEEEQAQARANIGFDGALKEYSGGSNIDITDYVVSVTGKKSLAIDDTSMSASEDTGAINIGVKDSYVENIAEGAVDTVITQKIQEGSIITTVYADSTMSGNGTSGSPLGVTATYPVAHDDTLTGDGVTANLGVKSTYSYTSPNNTITVDEANRTIEQTNSAVGSDNLVHELAWNSDLTALSSTVSTNTSNIATNTSNIESVSAQTTATQKYIEDNEAKWGAEFNANAPLTGTGSTENPLGISGLNVATTLSGNGVDTAIGLTGEYALQSDLESTQTTVLNNSNDIGNLQTATATLSTSIRNTNTTINNVAKNVSTNSANIDSLSGSIATNSVNIGTLSANQVVMTDVGSRGGTANRTQFYLYDTSDDYTQKQIGYTYGASGQNIGYMGYTITSATKDMLPQLTAVSAKQDKLYAGANITISDSNTISAQNVYHTVSVSDYKANGLSWSTIGSAYGSNEYRNICNFANGTYPSTISEQIQETDNWDFGFIHYTILLGFNIASGEGPFYCVYDMGHGQNTSFHTIGKGGYLYIPTGISWHEIDHTGLIFPANVGSIKATIGVDFMPVTTSTQFTDNDLYCVFIQHAQFDGFKRK